MEKEKNNHRSSSKRSTKRSVPKSNTVDAADKAKKPKAKPSKSKAKHSTPIKNKLEESKAFSLHITHDTELVWQPRKIGTWTPKVSVTQFPDVWPVHEYPLPVYKLRERFPTLADEKRLTFALHIIYTDEPDTSSPEKTVALCGAPIPLQKKDNFVNLMSGDLLNYLNRFQNNTMPVIESLILLEKMEVLRLSKIPSDVPKEPETEKEKAEKKKKTEQYKQDEMKKPATYSDICDCCFCVKTREEREKEYMLLSTCPMDIDVKSDDPTDDGARLLREENKRIAAIQAARIKREKEAQAAEEKRMEKALACENKKMVELSKKEGMTFKTWREYYRFKVCFTIIDVDCY